MDSENKLIINENDNLYKKLIDEKVEISSINEQIKIISSKVLNNKIGYSRLETRYGIVKIIICPKIFDYDEDLFLDYLSNSFNLISKNKNKAKLFKIEDSLLNLALLISSSQRIKKLSFDDLLEYKYLSSLNEIRLFFRKNRSKYSMYKDYVGNSLDYEIDTLSSITDPIKSNIHQKREILFLGKKLAEIAILTIDTFVRNTKAFLNVKTLTTARQIRGEIRRNFGIKKVTITLSEFFSNTHEGLFNTPKKRQLLNNLLLLLSKENFFNTIEGESHSNNYFRSHSLFFDASSIFELHAFEYLKKNYPNENIEIKPKKYQVLKSKYYGDVGELKSEPDFIINGDIVVDAKWKILNKLDSKFNYDFLKIKRDCKIFNTNNSVLIYPKVRKEILNKSPYFYDQDQDQTVLIVESNLI